MLCKIADLYTEIPEEGGIAPLLEDYRVEEGREADIVIRSEEYRRGASFLAGLSDSSIAYLESAAQFNYWVLGFGGMVLHASAVELDGRAYLFSGPSGMGKSTHTKLWQGEFPEAKIFNDDNPILRPSGDRWYAYGTPWSGSSHVNINMKAPLAGICFLKRGRENSIRRLTPSEAVPRLVHQTASRFKDPTRIDLMLSCVDKLATGIPIFELHSIPVPEAARLSYGAMLQAAKEIGL